MMTTDEALSYHQGERPGKTEVRLTKPCLSPRDLRLAYLPGALAAVGAIAADPSRLAALTNYGNLIAVVTNGTALPGLGAVGARAAKPMQEGTAVVFKRFADIDVFDLGIDTVEVDAFVETVRLLEPSFAGINLKDVAAPQGLDIYDRLQQRLGIPVFHENLYGPAIVVVAALINALELADKRIDGVRVTISGAGTVGIGCLRLLQALGMSPQQFTLFDRDGLVHPDRPELSPHQRRFATSAGERSLEAAVRGADVFIGAAAPGIMTVDMVRSMAARPVVLALSAPVPEIGYAEARGSRHDVIVCTARAGDPNALVDLLSFPYVFRGALDAEATRITESMMIAAARALAELAREEVPPEVGRAYSDERLGFGPEYVLPKPIDPRLLVVEAAAVAAQAVTDGVARRIVEPAAYREQLRARAGAGRELIRSVTLKARGLQPRIVLPEGTAPAMIAASAIIADEGIGSPILLGRPADVAAAAEGLGVNLGAVAVLDPGMDARAATYAEELYRRRARRGLIRERALQKIRDPWYFGAMMLDTGDADMMISGVTAPYSQSIAQVLEVIGPAPDAGRVAGLYIVVRGRDVYFLADCAVTIEPDAEQLAAIALLSAGLVRALGIDPRIAMLAYSNFGSVEHPLARKVRAATDLARAAEPDLCIDGEMQMLTALDRDIRETYFPFCTLRQNANVLIFPDLQSGSLALQLIQSLGDALVIGPVLLGTRRPVHLLQYGAAAEEVVNLAAVGAVYGADRGLIRPARGARTRAAAPTVTAAAHGTSAPVDVTAAPASG
jgi:malate dehydrogenase (oxaloacetate-decarboxylating)(NADP+)